MSLRHALLLLFVFAISVAARLPQLGRPVSKNHEFCTAVPLIVMNVWAERGFFKCLGCPAVTFAGECNGAAQGLTYSFMQRDGVKYYISHLPLAYYAPYFVLTALNVPLEEVPLRIFNLLCHAFIIVLLYRTVTHVLRTQVQPAAKDVPLYAAVLYALMPAPLWYHGNVYMSDMIVQLPWAWSLAIGMRLLQADRPTRWHILWFLLSIAACACTEWSGVFIALTFGGVFLHRAWRSQSKRWFWLGTATVAVMIIVTGGALLLYAHIAGWQMFKQYFTLRYGQRGTMVGEGSNALWPYLHWLVRNALTAWGPLWWLLGLGTLALLLKLREQVKLPSTFLVLTAVPAFAHLLVFVRYSGQEFALLKLGFLLCLLGGVVLAGWQAVQPRMALLLCMVTCATGITMYTWINRPGDGSATGDRYDLAQQRGQFIARTALAHERILVSGATVEPQLIYYAHRNMTSISEKEGEALRAHSDVPCAVVWFKFKGPQAEVVRPTIAPASFVRP